jgi:hypothetical protein
MDLNSDGKTIGTIIITIIFLVGLIIIIDEIYNLTKFAYRYTYLYNYGNMNEKVCNKNKLEYETARYRIYNEINKYKLEKDIFNKTWLNYLTYIGIFILSILLSISFGYLFYYLFINNNINCNEDPNNMSVIKQILQCLCADCHRYIPNCFINYLMVFILIVIYPLIYILKLGIKLDFTWNAGYYTKLLHILFFIGLVYYIIVIFMEKSDETNQEKYIKALIFTFYIIIFYMNNYIFNKTFDEFNSITKVYNLYNNKNEEQAEADTTFFDVYKQEEPLKPLSIDIPYSSTNLNLLQVFKYCKEEDFKEPNTYCNTVKAEGFEKDKKIMDNYYKQLENYENDMKIYKDKYNVYQNNKTNFPDVVYILYTMFPKLTGIQKREIQILFILLVILIITTYYLKSNKNKYGDYVFYTAFLYILGILSIIIITNAVLIYNTYVNKYLIYEPIHNYKNSMNNKNTIFNLIIKKDNSLKEFYKKVSDDSTLNINIGTPTNFNIDELIKKIKNKENIDNTNPIILSDSSLFSVQLKLYKTLYSYTLTDDKYTSQIADGANDNIKYNSYYTTQNYISIKGTPIIVTDYNNLKNYIKLLLVTDENAIKERIKQLKTNFKFYVFNDEAEKIKENGLILDKNAIKKKQEIKENAYIKIEGEINDYNLYLINKVFDIYQELLIDCRKIFIELFNNLMISCDYTNFINVDEKIAELDKKLLNNGKTNFKTDSNEPAINIYKKIIENIINKLNISLRKHINIIKIYIRSFEMVSVSSSTSKSDKSKLINKIINNYNLFASDENKHTINDFYKIIVKLKSNFQSSKYNTMDSLTLKKLNISTNNVSWSFVILIIIFTIILLEPLII